MTHLVIPCFNESRRLPHFLPGLCEQLERLGNVDVLGVDDGSDPAEANATRSFIETLRPHHPCLLPLLELPENIGKGGAVYAGWAAAPQGTDWLGFVDADGSCSAAETARLIRLATAPSPSPISPLPSSLPPALFASRVKMLGRSVDRQFKRHLLGRIYATLVSELLQIPVYDSQCGLKILPAAAYAAIRPHLKVQGFAFDVDLLVQLLDHGCPVHEVPIHWHEEAGGKVHLLRDSYRMFRDVLKIRQNASRCR